VVVSSKATARVFDHLSLARRTKRRTGRGALYDSILAKETEQARSTIA